MACRICNLASEWLNEGNYDSIFDLGSVEEVRHRSDACPSCRQILDIYKNDVEEYIDADLRLYAQGQPGVLSLMVNRDDQYGLGYRRLESFGTMGKQPHEFSKLDSPYIDVKRPRRWLDICDELHRGQCHHLPGWKTVAPLEELLLIDTEQGCLVQCPGTTKYFALSYLWGNIPDFLETRISNIEDLKRKGAFYSSIFSIPRTIQDSIRLVRELGERYLWVDRFCIIQEHPAKHSIISRMDSIYANAYCTIVATDGNGADYGIQGVGSPRTIFPQTVNLPQCPLVIVASVDYESRYYTRGWTYQELHLSPRQLLYTRGTVIWACQESCWREQMYRESAASVPDLSVSRFPFLKWPDLSFWEDLVSNYNWRELSFEGDAHVAFSGVEKVVERSFPGGFLYGLPEFFFDIALLWYPDERVNRRIKPSADNGYCLPSWSWLGWHGCVSAFPCDPIGDYVETGISTDYFRVSPLIKWIHIGPHIGQERTVRNDYHLWRAHGERQSVVPTGWKFHTAERGTYYTNVCIPDVRFQYHLPPPTELPLEDEQKTWPPYLRLRTYRAFFIIWPCGFESMLNTMVSLSDKNTRRAGVLFLHIDSQDAPFGDLCELVAISRGSIRQDPGKENLETFLADLYWEDIPKTDGIYEFYNVLCVKWEGGHVVREGVGRVEKSIWEQQDLEPFDAQLH